MSVSLQLVKTCQIAAEYRYRHGIMPPVSVLARMAQVLESVAKLAIARVIRQYGQ